jgi:hypothetical protein
MVSASAVGPVIGVPTINTWPACCATPSRPRADAIQASAPAEGDTGDDGDGGEAEDAPGFACGLPDTQLAEADPVDAAVPQPETAARHAATAADASRADRTRVGRRYGSCRPAVGMWVNPPRPSAGRAGRRR